MTVPNTDPTLESFSDLPVLPTGSGVADLEVAYEQMKLAGDAETSATAAAGEDVIASDPATTPTERGGDAAESAAHPS